MTPTSASLTLVIVFLASWIAAALWAGKITGSMPGRELAPLYGGGVLLSVVVGAAAFTVPAMKVRLWPEQSTFDWTMFAVCAAGLAICWWARLHLGRLWASGVVVREGHRVVDSGPYAAVRHPIYTGAFIASIAFAAIRARPMDIAASVVFIAFFSLKARVEERFLRGEFGAAYDDYSGRVPMLVPGLRWGAAAAPR